MNRLGSVLFLFVPLLGSAEDLYQTDFESFPAGENQWAGHDGWISNDTTSGAQGILDDFLEELSLGKVAYLGYEPPHSRLTTVACPVKFKPADGEANCLEFESLLGIQDSTNDRHDQFFISFYGADGSFLAAVVFDNNDPEAQVLRWQGRPEGSINESASGIPFIRGDQLLGLVSLQLLHIQIDFDANQWAAYLDGIPLWEGVPFTAPELASINIGSIAAEWELMHPSVSEPGNNWLLVTDWAVRPASKFDFQNLRQANPFELSISRGPNDAPTLSWFVEEGYTYQLQRSNDLANWEDVPNASFTDTDLDSTNAIEFTDTSTPQSNHRFYRVKRSGSP